MSLLPSHPPDRVAAGAAASEWALPIGLSALEVVDRPGSCLVVVAHPDDDCFGCSGTAAKWAAAGTVVDLVVITDGSKGSHDLSVGAAEVAAWREREQRASAKLLGYREIYFLGAVDGELVVSETVIRRTVELIRKLKPEFVIGHDPWRLYQLHPDHRAAGEVLRDAVWRAGEPRFYDLPPWKPRELWLFHAERPNHVEDVSDWLGIKFAALLLHESQFSSAFGFSEGDPEGRARFEQWFRERFATAGKAAGFAYGEAFRRIAV